MEEYSQLEDALTYGSSAEIDAAAAPYGLVRSISPDACEWCRQGKDVGHEHRDCLTLVPARAAQY